MSNRGRIVACTRCGKVRRHVGHGLCYSCYSMEYRKSRAPKVVCSTCQEERPHYSKGMCHSCYTKVYAAAHLEKHAETERSRRQSNPDHVRTLDRQRNQTEKRKQWKYEYGKKYYAENIERLQKYNRQWMKTHRDTMAHCAAVNQARRKALPHTLTRSEWREILDRYEHKCAYCGTPSQRLHREHKIPASRGGGYTADNIVPSCGSCNSRKHTMTPDEFDEYLKKYPR